MQHNVVARAVLHEKKGHDSDHDLDCLSYLTFPVLSQQEDLVHASLLKGKGKCASLTLQQASWGDLAKQASELSLQVAGMHSLSICWVKQCHSADILLVDSCGEQEEPADAMITRCPGLGLMVLHADCQALLFYDPIGKVIASAHVGWRGSAAHLPVCVVEKMQSAFQVKPENLLVAISPSMGPCHAYYPRYKEHLPENMWPYQRQADYFDFWALTRDQLLSAGVLAEHIQNAHLCTHAHADCCFSHRREGEAAGRHATFIAMRP